MVTVVETLVLDLDFQDLNDLPLIIIRSFIACLAAFIKGGLISNWTMGAIINSAKEGNMKTSLTDM